MKAKRESRACCRKAQLSGAAFCDKHVKLLREQGRKRQDQSNLKKLAIKLKRQGYDSLAEVKADQREAAERRRKLIYEKAPEYLDEYRGVKKYAERVGVDRGPHLGKMHADDFPPKEKIVGRMRAEWFKDKDK